AMTGTSNDTLALSSNQTFTAGTGSIAFNAQAAGSTISLAGGTTQTINSAATLTVSTPNLNFLGNNAKITSSGATAISLDSGGGSNALLITSPDNGSASITTTGGTIGISSGQTLTFSKSAGSNTTTLNLNGGAVTTTTSAATNVDASVTVASNNNITMNVN